MRTPRSSTTSEQPSVGDLGTFKRTVVCQLPRLCAHGYLQLIEQRGSAGQSMLFNLQQNPFSHCMLSTNVPTLLTCSNTFSKKLGRVMTALETLATQGAPCLPAIGYPNQLEAAVRMLKHDRASRKLAGNSMQFIVVGVFLRALAATEPVEH